MVSRSEFKDKYNNFVNQLVDKDSNRYVKMYTDARQKPFMVSKNSSNSIVVRAFTEESAPMVISFNQLERVYFEKAKHYYKSYEPILLTKILENTIINIEDIKMINTKDLDNNIRLEKNIASLNQIFYGPPGTGKTYNTINKALEIIDGIIPDNRSEAKKRFEELSNAGQIEFVTFHQSYGYEEFVEGIKANTHDGNISYDVESGIFKRLACLANLEITLKSDIADIDFKKYLSLHQKLILDNGKEIEIVDVNRDIIVRNSKSSEDLFTMKREKIIEHIKSQLFYNNNLKLGSYQSAIAKYIFGKLDTSYQENNKNKNYILIIDEINRGNISKIFGELITLIEPSKRIGAAEEIRLHLPYSNDEFGVPSNLYIIGTMNTADRSIALMDTALRRRFEFIEMMPDSKLLDFEVEGVNIKALLEKINARVEYLYDRDHTIGHAYFMELNAESSLDDLNIVMKNKIIPLLQEYFYDDWEKIKLVLNDGFIEKIEMKASQIFDTDMDDEYIEDEKFLYSIKDDFELESYLRLCQKR